MMSVEYSREVGELKEVFKFKSVEDFKEWEKDKIRVLGIYSNATLRECDDERPCINCFADNGDCLGK